MAGIIERVRDKKTRDLACVAGGMGALLCGQKLLGLSLFAAGFKGLEERWREEHDFQGSFEERWERATAFYEATHQDPVNRFLHVVGIPLVAGGAAGLIMARPFRPVWLASAGAFGLGWALNFVGHGLFEKKAPAFSEDPLSFLAGPVWDWQNIKARRFGRAPEGRVVPAHEPDEAFAAA